MPIALSEIAQVLITVTDVDRSVAFYRDVLGMKLLFQVEGQPMAFFDCEGTRVYLGESDNPDFPSSKPLLYFRVPDVDAAYQELIGAGVEFVGSPHTVHTSEGLEVWMGFFKDPDNTHLALMEERLV